MRRAIFIFVMFLAALNVARAAEIPQGAQTGRVVDRIVARVEGDIISDISFGGGIAGKIYRGGHFVMEQSEVAPGVWLPTLFTYDVDGRKFLFGFGIHERTEISRYRHLGPPSQSIEIIRAELNNLAAGTPAH